MGTDNLDSWIASADAALTHFAEHTGLPKLSINIQRAAMSALLIHDPIELLDRYWTVECLTSLLADTDFRALADAEEIVMPESILPPGAPRRLDEETVKWNSEHWWVHKYDKDPFPSSPHAHNYSENVKMDLSTGACYRGRKHVYSISRKHLLQFRNLVKRNTLPPLKA